MSDITVSAPSIARRPTVERSGGLSDGARGDLTRAAARVDGAAVKNAAERVAGARAAADGFARVTTDASEARPITPPSRIATVDAPKMTVNTDGAGEKNGRHYQPQTAFQVGGKYLDAQQQSFLAMRPQDLPRGAKMGDPVEITIKGGKVYDEATKRDRDVPDRTVYGILGDRKGRHHGFAVEGSSKVHENAGGTARPNSGTIVGDVRVRVAVGAGEGLVGRYGSGPARIPTEQEIQDYARRVFADR